MTADAVLRVTEALRERLKAALTASGVPGSVFVGPLDDADASGAALVLFLYRVVPNASLRNQEHRVPSTKLPPAPPVEVYQNALPLDLYYLVTVGTTPGASEETVRVSLEPLTTEESSRIWALFPTANYRTSIAYLASPVWIDPPKPATPAARVVQDELNAGTRAPEPEPVPA